MTLQTMPQVHMDLGYTNTLNPSVSPYSIGNNNDITIGSYPTLSDVTLCEGGAHMSIVGSVVIGVWAIVLVWNVSILIAQREIIKVLETEEMYDGRETW